MPKDLAITKAFNQHRQLIDLETYWAPLCCRKYTTEHLSSQHKTPYFVKQNTLLCIAKESVLQCKRDRFAMQEVVFCIAIWVYFVAYGFPNLHLGEWFGITCLHGQGEYRRQLLWP